MDLDNNRINELNKLAGYEKESKQKIFDKKEEAFRKKYDVNYKHPIDNYIVTDIIVNYLDNIPSELKSSYDVIELINFTKEITIPDGINNGLDIIDYIRYSYYYRNDNFDKNEIIKILEIPIHKESFVSLDGITYAWNSRKEAFNKLRHKLGIYEAVTILQSNIKLKILQNNDRYLVFSIADIGDGKKYFSVVEIEETENFIRIINCRRSSEKEMIKEKSKYENNK